MENTKERILLTALELFARDGYEAVSVSTIAGALGMTKGALYRHYANKRAIFESIVKRMETKDGERARAGGVPEGTLAQIPQAYERTSRESFCTFCVEQFRYWTEDPFAAAFRRMLTLEQYRTSEMGALYQQYLGAGPTAYTADLLQAMGEKEPQKQAIALYGSMFLLYALYDGAEEKQAIEQLARDCISARLKKEEAYA